MYRDRKISLVIPAYNESKLIVPTLEKVPEEIDRIYVIDDASTDSMPEVVRNMAKKDHRIVLLHHKKNMGVGQGIITGYLKSNEDNYDIAVVCGGDDQMDLSEVRKFLDPLIDGKADYTKGNRFLIGGNAYTDMPVTRFVGNLFFTFLTKFSSGYWKIYDIVDGYTAMTNEAIGRVNWDSAWKGYGYVCDWPALFNLYKIRMKDIPRRAIYLQGEKQSQIKGVRYVMRMVPRLVYRFWWRMTRKYMLHDFHPLVFFYFLGFTLFPAGLAIGIKLIYDGLSGGISHNVVVLCALLIITGLQFLLFGMLFDMQDNEDLST